MQARRQDGGAGRALRHLGDPVGKFFPLKILAGILYFPVPGVEKKKKLPVPRVTEISTVHLFISNLTRAVWGLPRGGTSIKAVLSKHEGMGLKAYIYRNPTCIMLECTGEDH